MKKIRLNLNLKQPQCTGELATMPVGNDLHRIDTYGVDGSRGDSDELVVVFQPWSDYVARRFGQQRLDVIAEAMGARVIGVDNLGIGDSTSSIPQEMRREIARGDFSGVNQLQWEAVRANQLYSSDSKLTLAYFSLGASMAAAMTAHAPEGVHVDRLILWESVAIKQSIGRLALTYAVDGGKKWKEYLAENPAWVAPPSSFLKLAQAIARQPAAHYLYPRGMARGKIQSDLERSFERGVLGQDSVVYVMNGSESRLSSTAYNDELASAISRLPVAVGREVHEGETHAINDSFPRVSAVLGELGLN